MSKTSTIRFRKNTEVGVVSRKGRFKGVDLVKKGFETDAHLSNAHVVEDDGDMIETVDIETPSGETWVDIPYASFRFV